MQSSLSLRSAQSVLARSRQAVIYIKLAVQRMPASVDMPSHDAPWDGITFEFRHVGTLTGFSTAEALLKHIKSREGIMGPLYDPPLSRGQVVKPFTDCPTKAACSAARVLDG